MTKYSIHDDGTKVIHFNTEEEYEEHLKKDDDMDFHRPTILGFIVFFILSWILTTYLFKHFNIEFSKNIKFTINSICGVGFGYLGYLIGRLLFSIILMLIIAITGVGLLYLIGTYLYKIA